MTITVHPFFVEKTSDARCGYIVANPESRTCAVIDAPAGASAGGRDHTACADQMLAWVFAHDFVVRWIIETHVQAQDTTATAYLRRHLLCAQTAAAADIALPDLFDQPLNNGDKLCLGHACARVLTRKDLPGELALQIDNKLFVSGRTGIEPWLSSHKFGYPAASRVFVSRLNPELARTVAYCSAISPTAVCGNLT
ncbi:MAG: hypothetical protein ACFHXK_13545 [bacterium]